MTVDGYLLNLRTFREVEDSKAQALNQRRANDYR